MILLFLDGGDVREKKLFFSDYKTNAYLWKAEKVQESIKNNNYP